MSEEINIGGQKLGVLVDDTVNSKTLNWIKSLATETLVRDAAVEMGGKDPELKNFVNQLITGEVDVVLFLTSDGLTRFMDRAIKSIDRVRLANSLNDIRTVAVGTLVDQNLRSHDIVPTMSVPDDVDWRELLVTLDQECPVTNMAVGLEVTANVHELVAGLEARGANVLQLDAHAFQRTDPTAAEQDILDAIEDGQLGTLLFPNPVCAARFAALISLRDLPSLKRNTEQLVVMALGAETQQILCDRGIACDVMLSQSQLRAEIQNANSASAAMSAIGIGKERVKPRPSNTNSASQDQSAAWYNSPFMKAVRREPVDVTPIWMMRQAGRYMQEYRDVRSNVSFLDLCKNPQLCSEVMCTAVARLGVDAAIIFSDLLPILEPMGCELEYVKGDGPVIHNPIMQPSDVDRIVPLDSNEQLDFVMETVRLTRSELPADMPLIGFAGAPFTLASYMIEGKSNRTFARTKQIMFGDPEAWDVLMSKLVQSIIIYLKGQIEAGAQCVQLFDSWAGCLSTSDYRSHVLPHVNQVIDAIAPLAPVINFATGNPALLPELAAGQAQVVGIDWRVDLDNAWEIVGHDRAVQGNLDPTVLLTDLEQIRSHAERVLKHADNRNGHIFNLGHGILPTTPVGNAIALVEIVHELSAR